MEAIRQIVKIPDNHEIRIRIPHYTGCDTMLDLQKKKPDLSFFLR